MSDTNNTGDKTISVERKKTLTLKRNVEQGTVRQSFSHGRSKAVVVEKKKRRLVMPGSAEANEQATQKAPAPAVAPKVAAPAPAPSAPAQPKKPVVDRKDAGRLSNNERDARAAALKEARERELEDNKRREVEENQRREREELNRKKREEEERLKQVEETREEEKLAQDAAEAEARASEEAARAEKSSIRPVRTDKQEKTPAAPAAGGRAGDAGSEDVPGALRAVKRPKAAEVKPTRRGGEDRRRNKLTITSALNDDGTSEARGRSMAAMKRRREKEKRAAQQNGPREKISRDVVIPETITIQELANRMAERAVELIKILMKQGQMVKINDVIDADTAQLIAEELGHSVRRVAESDVEDGLFDQIDDGDDMEPRPPVVTIMGHVDHGKTSLLDTLREANVVAGEAGGITQHIGAYQVEHGGHKITFIDTPGHAAFTSMRARGAKATDIVILVVASDDGVMPQTIEAINHAKAAEVPIIVAINKMDLPAADPSRVRTELLQHDVYVESLGGEILDVEVSATQKMNLDTLLEAIVLQSELLELRANSDREGEGTVIEAKLDKGRGPVATTLVQRGTLSVGDILIAGAEWGRVRALIDDHGVQVKDAGPSMPVEVLGLQATPEAGDRFIVVESEARAREITEYRQRKRRIDNQVRGARGSLEQMMDQLKETGRSEFPLVIKGDVQGSVEAIIGALDKLATDEVMARVVHSGVGGITESDITLANASNASILGFNVRANSQARDAASQTGCELRYYNVIYNLIDDVKGAMSGLLAPERRETFLGNAEVLEVFNISKIGKIAGCLITEGTVERGAHVRLIRDNVVIHEGTLSTLKRFKDEVKDVPAGQECGMAFENYQDLRAKDVIECFRVEEITRSL